MLTPGQTLIMIAVMALFTLLTRAAAFVLFPPHKPTPAYVVYLGKVLPYAIIAMLVVYCLKEISFAEASGWLPELIGVAVTAATYLWRRNSLLSIAAGTILYMVLVQAVFAP